MVKLTLNQIIQKVRTYAEDHPMIQTVRSDKKWNYEDTDITYPALLFDVTDVSIAGKILTYEVTMLFVDRQIAGDENLYDTQSDQLQVATDIVAQLHYDQDIDMSQNVALQMLQEENGDYLSGVLAVVNINTPHFFDRCAIPTE